MVKQLQALCVFILFFSSGCNQEVSNTPPGLNEKLQFSDYEYKSAIKKSFSSKNHSASPVSSIVYPDTLYQYYSGYGFEPILLKSFEEHGFVESILTILRNSSDHGLDPADYHVDLISQEFVKAVTGDSVFPARYEFLSNTELLLADAVINYSYHLRYGKSNPVVLFNDSYFLPLKDSLSRDIFEPLKQGSILNYLQEIKPETKRYKGLQAALKQFLKYKDLEWQPIPVPLKKIEPGNTDPSVSLIASRLLALDILDTINTKREDPEYYDTLLTAAVKEFQRRNGLIEDGIIGKATVERLNITPAEYIEKIKINLERARWTDYSGTPKYIMINIPDFKLYVLEDGVEKLSIKVCTGLKRQANYKEQFELYQKTKRFSYKPDDWETPCFSSEISNLVLNPTWTVPQSIIREEIAREVRKDSTYLLRKNFKVYKDGQIINPAEVSSSEFINRTGFTVVQDPGPLNALGRIKFMFKNPFGIYLHDTPSRAPFNQANRAVSHGCIRVEKPILLSEYLLTDNSDWLTDYLRIEVGLPAENADNRTAFAQKRNTLRKNSGYGKTTEVKLNNKIPLYIDYYTAWMDDDGIVHFRDDVYRRDKVLKEFLYPEDTVLKMLAMN